MYVIHWCYEATDPSRIEELSHRVNKGLLPRLRTLPGFKGYLLLEAGHGVIKSTSLFETSGQAEASIRVAAEWTQAAKLESLVPNPPKVTVTRVIAHESQAGVFA
jgi:hypothetical protein